MEEELVESGLWREIGTKMKKKQSKKLQKQCWIFPF